MHVSGVHSSVNPCNTCTADQRQCRVTACTHGNHACTVYPIGYTVPVVSVIWHMCHIPRYHCHHGVEHVSRVHTRYSAQHRVSLLTVYLHRGTDRWLVCSYPVTHDYSWVTRMRAMAYPLHHVSRWLLN